MPAHSKEVPNLQLAFRAIESRFMFLKMLRDSCGDTVWAEEVKKAIDTIKMKILCMKHNVKVMDVNPMLVLLRDESCPLHREGVDELIEAIIAKVDDDDILESRETEDSKRQLIRFEKFLRMSDWDYAGRDDITI